MRETYGKLRENLRETSWETEGKHKGNIRET